MDKTKCSGCYNDIYNHGRADAGDTAGGWQAPLSRPAMGGEMSGPTHPYDGLMTMAYLLDRYGDPVFRGTPEGWTIEEREDFNIPTEVIVFKHPKNPRVPIVWGCMGGDRWSANYGERTVIGLLLDANP